MTTSENMVVQELHNQEDRTAWDTFVYNSQDSLPFHQTVWRDILHTSYGYPCHFLFVRQVDRVVGVLPLFQVNSPIKGCSLQSLPGAVCAKGNDVALTLISGAEALAKDLKADYLLLRDSRYDWSDSKLDVIEIHRGVKRSLSQDSELIWRVLPKDIRYHIRHGRKRANIKVVIGTEGVDELYDLLLRIHRQLGTPLFGKKFLRQVTNLLVNGYILVRIYIGDVLVAGYLNLIYKQQVFGLWGGALAEYREFKITYQAIWETIEYGCRTGLTVLDMNRSIFPSGQYDFKSPWGDNTYPIYQIYHSFRGKTPIEIQASLKRLNKTANPTSEIWQRLPLPITGILGPVVRRYIPFG
jgi:FemAB-related protein (PEP-CTERM system-associated)